MSYIKKKSKRQEERTAKDFGGRTQVASGALWGSKGDVRTGSDNTGGFKEEDFLIENKFTDKDTYKLELKIWDKIAKEALRDGLRTPLMQIDIQDTQVAVMDVNAFEMLDIHGDVLYIPALATPAKSLLLERSKIIQLNFDAQVVKKTLAMALLLDMHKTQRQLVLMMKDDFIYYNKQGRD